MTNRILIFIDWYLPGTSAGGPVRSVANVIDHLGGEFHFSIITRNSDYCASEPYPGITPDCWTNVNDHCRVYYLSGKNNHRNALKRLIRETPFDVVWINGIYSWKFSILSLLLLRKSAKRTVVSPRGMLNPQAFTSGRFKKKLFIALARKSGLYRGMIFHTTNEDEKQHILRQLGQKTKVMVAPNLARKNFQTKLQSHNNDDQLPLHIRDENPEIQNLKSGIRNSEAGYRKTPGFLRLVSIARISPEKGTLHALRFLKQIRGGVVRFDLYGPVYNEEYWKECLKVIGELPGHITVEHHGPVEGDRVGEVLSGAHFLLMPTEGENFGHSILEALSAGRPVIISDRTPWENLKVRKAGFDLPLEESSAFVRALERTLAMDEAEWQQWSSGAESLAMEYAGNSDNVEASRKLLSEK